MAITRLGPGGTPVAATGPGVVVHFVEVEVASTASAMTTLCSSMIILVAAISTVIAGSAVAATVHIAAPLTVSVRSAIAVAIAATSLPVAALKWTATKLTAIGAASAVSVARKAAISILALSAGAVTASGGRTLVAVLVLGAGMASTVSRLAAKIVDPAIGSAVSSERAIVLTVHLATHAFVSLMRRALKALAFPGPRQIVVVSGAPSLQVEAAPAVLIADPTRVRVVARSAPGTQSDRDG